MVYTSCGLTLNNCVPLLRNVFCPCVCLYCH